MKKTKKKKIASKRLKKKKRKWLERIDNTFKTGASGRQRRAYRWTVEYGKHQQSGTCFSYSEAEREQADARRRIEDAIHSGDKAKAEKCSKLTKRLIKTLGDI